MPTAIQFIVETVNILVIVYFYVMINYSVVSNFNSLYEFRQNIVVHVLDIFTFILGIIISIYLLILFEYPTFAATVIICMYGIEKKMSRYMKASNKDIHLRQIEYYALPHIPIDLSCTICFDSMLNNDIIVISCKHKFHKECINDYIKYKIGRSIRPICPLCRAKI
jgi:hypothetical protein